MKILIADDDSIPRRLLHAALVKAGHEVVSTCDGTEAWQVLQAADAPRLVILDWLIPGMDGVEVCRRVRQRDTAPYSYLILLTSKDRKEDLIAGLEAGADDYLTKPYRKLYLLLVKRENQVWTPYEQHVIREEVKAVLTLLWRTGEIFLQKPDVSSERRNIIHYLYTVFPDVLPVLDVRLQQSWEYCGFDPDLLRSPQSLPRLRFGTWVGGERDGHPLVTAEVTQGTLADLQKHALQLLQHQLLEFAHQLSLSDRFQQPPPILTNALARLATQLGERGQLAIGQDPEESWRQMVNLMLARLPVGQSLPVNGRKERDTTRYQRAAELLDDLSVLYDSLVEVGAGRLAAHAVWPVMRVVQTFGFHLASLDLRQKSRFHDLAIAQLLTAAGQVRTDFPQWDEEQRLEFLFFHGRGGTPSRGGGPEHRFVKSMLHAALSGNLRVTEQGETIAQKYANRMMADIEVMRDYALLIEDTNLREYIFGKITAEFECTRKMLEQVYGGPLAERRPNIHGMSQMRRNALRTLHRQQITLLRQWRGMRQHGKHEAAASLLPSLLLTVNAIASGLGATG